MIKTVFFSAIVGLVAFGGCKGQDTQGGPKSTKDSVVYKGVTDSGCAAEIQYGSYASGIDGEAYRKTMSLIGRWGLSYTSTNIGREGETRICLPLTELKSRQRKALIDSLIHIARTGDLVSVSVR